MLRRMNKHNSRTAVRVFFPIQSRDLHAFCTFYCLMSPQRQQPPKKSLAAFVRLICFAVCLLPLLCFYSCHCAAAVFVCLFLPASASQAAANCTVRGELSRVSPGTRYAPTSTICRVFSWGKSLHYYFDFYFLCTSLFLPV